MIANASFNTSRLSSEMVRCDLIGSEVGLIIFKTAACDGRLSVVAREVADTLAASWCGLSQGAVRVASLAPSGRPVLFVEGRPARQKISLSHIEGLVAAAVSNGSGVGIDLVDPAEAGRGLDFWLSPDELALEPDEGLLRARLWAAKEAAYKAACLDDELRPKTVTIRSLAPHAFTWTARSGFTTATGDGRFLAAGRHVVAVAGACSRRRDAASCQITPEMVSA